VTNKQAIIAGFLGLLALVGFIKLTKAAPPSEGRRPIVIAWD
jgi:hypothetical protein